MKIEEAHSEDVPKILSMLEGAGLTREGVDDAKHYVVRADGNRIVATIGFEVWGSQGLLRSLVVEEDERGKGLGSSLVLYVLELARKLRLEEVFLLTDKVGEYYLKFGFEYYDRRRVSGAVLNSAEFRGACLETAPVMRFAL